MAPCLERNRRAKQLQPQLFSVPCTADFDHSGGVDILDVDLQDAAVFIDAYNNGC